MHRSYVCANHCAYQGWGMGWNGSKGLLEEWTLGDWKDKHCSYPLWVSGCTVDAWSQCLLFLICVKGCNLYYSCLLNLTQRYAQQYSGKWSGGIWSQVCSSAVHIINHIKCVVNKDVKSYKVLIISSFHFELTWRLDWEHLLWHC